MAESLTSDADAMLTQQIISRLDRIDSRMDGLVSRPEHTALVLKFDQAIQREEYNNAYQASNVRMERIEKALDSTVASMKDIAPRSEIATGIEAVVTALGVAVNRIDALEKAKTPQWLTEGIRALVVTVIGGGFLYFLQNHPLPLAH